MRTDILTQTPGQITIRRDGTDYKINPLAICLAMSQGRLRIYLNVRNIAFSEPLGDIFIDEQQLDEENAEQLLAAVHQAPCQPPADDDDDDGDDDNGDGDNDGDVQPPDEGNNG